MVRAPLCAFDVKTGIFCAKCEAKIRSGEVTDVDVAAIKALVDLEEKFPILQDVNFHRAVRVGRTIAILVDHEDIPKMLSSGGKILKALGDSLKKKVRVFENKGDLRTFIESLFSPLNVLSVNTIWVPDGSQEIRVILSGPERSLPMDLESLKKLAKELRNLNLRIDFEHPKGRGYDSGWRSSQRRRPRH
ncbi:MAG: hypothetical protein QW220_06495 [Candidatus Bathyarchaeia archaeon]